MLLLRNLTIYSLLLAAIGAVTWHVARPPQRPLLPTYVCVVPSDIPPTISFPDGETIDLHRAYREGHREGWDEYLAAFVHNRCGRKLRHQGPTFSSDLDVPFRHGSFCLASQMTFNGRGDGYDACLRALGMPHPWHGRSTTNPDVPNWDDNWRFAGYRFAYREDDQDHQD